MMMTSSPDKLSVEPGIRVGSSEEASPDLLPLASPHLAGRGSFPNQGNVETLSYGQDGPRSS